ncbi:MAG: hypothetical protein Q4C60_06195 [Eubacteriales bacterium]|nr:hypothetical protein [Eubacteriales bacterium]
MKKGESETSKGEKASENCFETHKMEELVLNLAKKITFLIGIVKLHKFGVLFSVKT